MVVHRRSLVMCCIAFFSVLLSLTGLLLSGCSDKENAEYERSDSKPTSSESSAVQAVYASVPVQDVIQRVPDVGELFSSKLFHILTRYKYNPEKYDNEFAERRGRQAADSVTTSFLEDATRTPALYAVEYQLEDLPPYNFDDYRYELPLQSYYYPVPKIRHKVLRDYQEHYDYLDVGIEGVYLELLPVRFGPIDVPMSVDSAEQFMNRVKEQEVVLSVVYRVSISSQPYSLVVGPKEETSSYKECVQLYGRTRTDQSFIAQQNKVRGTTFEDIVSYGDEPLLKRFLAKASIQVFGEYVGCQIRAISSNGEEDILFASEDCKVREDDKW